jgi:methionyl aminopeptidase
MGTAGGISRAEAGIAYDAAQKVVEAHRRLSGFLHAGLTLSQVDIFVAQTLEALGCRSCFLGYRVPRSPPFPSHACLSVNDCVVHGTAGYTLAPLKEGDVLKVDIGVLYRGWVGDAAWTYFIGEPAPLARGLGECGKEALKRGIETLRPENTYLRWAQVVQDFVERQCGFHLVRGLGGHGYGRKVHQSPFVSNVVSLHRGPSSPSSP